MFVIVLCHEVSEAAGGCKEIELSRLRLAITWPQLFQTFPMTQLIVMVDIIESNLLLCVLVRLHEDNDMGRMTDLVSHYSTTRVSSFLG